MKIIKLSPKFECLDEKYLVKIELPDNVTILKFDASKIDNKILVTSKNLQIEINVESIPFMGNELKTYINNKTLLIEINRLDKQLEFDFK